MDGLGNRDVWRMLILLEPFGQGCGGFDYWLEQRTGHTGWAEVYQASKVCRWPTDERDQSCQKWLLRYKPI